MYNLLFDRISQRASSLFVTTRSLCLISILLTSFVGLRVDAAPKYKTIKVSLGDPDEGIADQFCKNHYRRSGKIATASSYKRPQGVIECTFNDVDSSSGEVQVGTGGINGTLGKSTTATTGTRIFGMGQICQYKFSQRYHNQGRQLTSINWDGFGKTCTAMERVLVN
jgi:hypothetical protein